MLELDDGAIAEEEKVDTIVDQGEEVDGREGCRRVPRGTINHPLHSQFEIQIWISDSRGEQVYL